jgi:2-dehydropantoate 2-reductase
LTPRESPARIRKREEEGMQKICVFGMGGIGGFIGARLDSALEKMAGPKPELAFIARGTHLEAIRSKGLVYLGPDGTSRTCRPGAAVERAADLGSVDMVFLCVKGYDIASACESLTLIAKPETVIIPLLNGIDVYERTKKILKNSVVLPACIYISSSIKEPGMVHHSGGKGAVTAGHDPARKDFDPTELSSLMSAASIPFEWRDDPMPALWTKFLFISSFGLVTAMSGKPVGGVIEDPELQRLVRSIIKEVHTLARAKGVRLSDTIEEDSFAKGRAFPYETKTSFQRDVEIPGKPNEGDLFGGTILRFGTELGIPTPVTETVYRTIQDKTARP